MIWRNGIRKSHWLLAGFLMMVLLSLSGCSNQVLSKVWLEAPGWSRGILVGSSAINEPVALQINGEDLVYLASFTNTDPPHPRLQQFNESGVLAWEQIYGQIENEYPTQPRLVLTPDEVFFFWKDGGRLLELALNQDGEVLTGPTVISGELEVDSYDVDLLEDELTLWIGGSDAQPGIFMLDDSDTWQLVDPIGSRPDVSVDSDGNLHLAWAHLPANRLNTEFVYGFFPEGSLAEGHYHVVLQPEFRTTDRITGPRIALAGNMVYIFWTTEIKTGLQAGEIVSSYVTFSQGQQRHFIAGVRIMVPGSSGLDYDSQVEDSFHTGPRMAWTPEDYGTTQILDLTPNLTLTGQVVIALKARVSFRNQPDHSQIGILFFNGPDYTSYQLLTTSQAASENPTLISGSDGSLYLSWLEKNSAGEDVIYLATTSSAMGATFDEVSGADVREMLSEAVFGLLSGAAFVPFVLIWLVPPLLLVALTSKLRRPDDDVFSPRTLTSLVLSLGGYWLIKLGMVPTLWNVVPFLVWIPIIPTGWQLVLRIGIPILIAGLGLLIAYRATYGRDRKSPFLFIVLYAIVDGLFTMAVYGYSLMGF